MLLNRLFDVVEEARASANVRGAFGESQVLDGLTLIPVATVSHGFGLWFGAGQSSDEEDAESKAESGSDTDGGGTGGAVSTRPVGVIIVTAEGVSFQPTVDTTKVNLGGILLGMLIVYQVAKTLRVILGRE